MMKTLPILVLFAIALVIISLLLLIRVGYVYEWTGFGAYENQRYGIFVRSKTLWDWMEIMLVPATLAVGVGAFFLNFWQTNNAERLSRDNQRQATLEAYFDKTSDLLLTYDLKQGDNRAGAIARTRTLATLRQLDSGRKAQLLNPLLNLSGADFSEAMLRGADLSYAKLNGTSLKRADLQYAHMIEADLTGVRFDRANLENCDFTNAILTGANFQDANVKGAVFDGAKLRDVNFRHSNAPKELVAASRKIADNENN
jgi:hypothetical protein